MDIADHLRARDTENRRTRELLIWRFRLGALVFATAQTIVEPGDVVALSWTIVAVFTLSVAASWPVLRRTTAERTIRRVGAAAMAVDTAIVFALLANNTTDPAEPIYLVTVLALLEATMRWPRHGGGIGGVVAGLAAGAWTIGVYHRTDETIQFAFASMRAGVLVVLGIFFGALTHRLSDQHRALQRVLDTSRDIIVTLDSAGTVLAVNAAVEPMLGWRPEEVIGRDSRIFLDAEQPIDLADAALLSRLEPGGPPLLALRRFLRSDGSYRWLELSVSSDPETGMVYVSGRDVTERLEVERQIATSEQRFRSLFDHNADAVYALDTRGRFTAANPATEQLTGFRTDELCATTFDTLVAPEHLERTQARFEQALGGESQTYDTVVIASDGRRIDLDVTNMPIVVDEEVVGVFGVGKDVTVRRRLERQLSHQARHDSLTGLPNRLLLEEIVETAMGARPAPVTLLFIDLDRFKIVNDSLGHRSGDELLVAVAERLAGCLRGDDVLARWAGDEFCVLLAGNTEEAEAVAVTERLLGALSERFDINGREIHLSASIGIAHSRAGDSPERLVQMADLAMYDAKRAGRNRYSIHEPECVEDTANAIDLEMELRHAIGADALVLEYQPIVEIGTGRIVAVESLVRWVLPDGSVRPPDEFISAAEDSGLIRPITRWVIEEVCRQLARWDRAIGPLGADVCAWVNVSGVDLQDPRLVPETVDALQRAGIAAERLVLEVTESTLLLDLEQVDRTVDALRHLGVSLAIDDFGTGYSSMNQLHRLRVAACKIDRTFVAGATGNERDVAIIRSLADIGIAFGFRVVGEGVETVEQLEVLEANGCELAQGFLIARPCPPGEVADLLRTGYVDLRRLVH